MTNNNDGRKRYRNTSDAALTDGRDIDTAIATLEGEAAQQQAPRADSRTTNIAPAPWNRVPRVAEGVERVASAIPKIGEPLHRGHTGFLWKLASGLTAVSLGLSLIGGRGRKRTVVAGVLGMGGSLCLRFAVHYASNDSARDPTASFQQQRTR